MAALLDGSISEPLTDDADLFGDALRTLDLLPVAAYICRPDGSIVGYNARAAELWGRAPRLDDPEERFCGSLQMYRLDGRALPHSDCPMAETLQSGASARDQEVVIVRPDGTRAVALVNIGALCDTGGKMIGAINCFQDITGRKRAPAAPPDSTWGAAPLFEHRSGERAAQMLASIVESSGDAIVSKDLNGIIATWNRGAERLFGYSAEEAVGNPIMMLIPPGRHNEEPEILDRIRRGDRVDHYETVRQHKDGSLIDISLTVSPIRDAEGKVIGASKIARDITERKRVEEQGRLLIREMNHRVKNLFSLAAAIVTISARHAESAQAMAEAVRLRLAALSRAHDLTLRHADAYDGSGAPTTLRLLLETLLAAYTHGAEDERTSLSGPDVAVGGQTVPGLALVFHEMATNAAKYGALATEGGTVAVTWLVDGETVNLTWREAGGARRTEAPDTSGFGTQLADATIRQLGGTIARLWRPEGLEVSVSLPLRSLTR